MAVAEELLEYAARFGVDPQPYRRRLGLSSAGPSSVDARISAVALMRLWEDLPRACADPDFGLNFAASIASPTSNLGTLLVASSVTLNEGIARFLANEPAFNNLLPTQLEHHAEHARIVLDPARASEGPVVPHHAVEAVLAWWWLMICRVLGTPLCARRVELTHLAPADLTGHRHVFGIEPQFGCSRNVLTFDAEVLRRPLATRSARLRLVAEQTTRQIIESIPTKQQQQDPAQDIREQITRALEQGEAPSQADIARAMSVSVRTLQRMLSSSQTSFSTLMDEERYREARRLLRRTPLPMQDIARRLGYYDPAGFFRAFKRWTGMTPGDFRRRGPSLDSTPP